MAFLKFFLGTVPKKLGTVPKISKTKKPENEVPKIFFKNLTLMNHFFLKKGKCKKILTYTVLI